MGGDTVTTDATPTDRNVTDALRDGMKRIREAEREREEEVEVERSEEFYSWWKNGVST